VAPSVRGLSATLAATAPVAVLLTGCVSTQTVAARARLVDARIIASQAPTVVTRANAAVSVSMPTVIRGPAGSAIVVSLHNDSGRALTDLPISVGVRTRSGRELYLNRSANLDYFASHLAAIAAHATTTWVFTTSARLPAGKTFVTVGHAQLHPTLSRSLPSITVSVRGGRSLAVLLVNRSTIPQYDVPVYAVALRAGREVAAGRTLVAHLGTYGTTTSSISLLGSARYDSLQLTASPTIFH
jgi:hypothetical protein